MSFTNPKIKLTALIFQNKHGTKYYSHYYTTATDPLSSQPLQKKLQQTLRSKSSRLGVSLKPEQTEIFTIENYTVLFKQVDQLQIYLVVGEDENFVLMEEVVNLIVEVLLMINKGPYTGKIIYDLLGDIVLVCDEIVDYGYIVNLDAQTIYDRVKMKEGTGSPKPKETKDGKPTAPVPANNASGTFSSLFGFAKNTLNKTLNLG